MQEDVGVDHYARHEELFKKRLSLLRESLGLVEQRRRMTRERASSPALKRVILRLKQSQADALDVKCKNQKLLQAVDDMLMEKQAQLPIKSATNVTTKELCCKSSAIVKEQKLNDTCSDVGQEGAVIIRSSDPEAERQHQATSHIKLQDLGSSIKTTDTDASCLSTPITCSSPHEKVLFGTCEEFPAQYIVSELQAIIPHSTLVMEEKLALHSIITVESSKSVDIDNIARKNQHQDTLTDKGSVCTSREDTNEPTSGGCSDLPCLNNDFIIQEIYTHTEQQNEHLTYKHEKLLEQGDDCSKPRLLSFVKESEVATDAGDTVPSRFLIADVGHQIHDQDRTLIRRKRAELATSPSKEKLMILDNIYSAIHQSQHTLWAYQSEHVWNPGLVFSTIEAARVGEEEVRKVLNSKDSGSRLLICCEAICELVHAFPPESLVPSKFVEECLLATQSVKVDIHDWVKKNLLTTYQDVDSALFWDSLTRHAVYLVAHELATAKQIASIFTGILLPASRLNDTVKDVHESARVNLHIFIAILLGTKDALATLSSQVNGCLISSGLDCDSAHVALYKYDNDNSRHEWQESALLPIVQMPTVQAEEPAKNVKSTSPRSCLSCSLLVKCLPWKKSNL
ncbi:hypothetical protein GOP47_0009619 [Adiantum capillus-veneris]|uniref:Uncharacterized protein n=1 Tax=Adiantum capillus-veneris TaxID=13818 RepID=A0A9D4UXU1_ADICA|nr:hypothetical protein GOP47_0009619 [Adiantum capillus-veneris]